MLFSELYSAYYNAVAAILREAAAKPLSREEMRAIVEKHAFGESFVTIEEALRNGRWQLLREDGTSVLKKSPEMPLTLLQKRWLKAISLDPRVKLFGDCIPDFPEVEPLFTGEDYEVFDCYSDGDDYSDEGYIGRFRLILRAIGERTPLRFEVKKRTGAVSRFTAMPEYLEYSEKDDKFRLITSGCRYGSVVNLGRIVSCGKCFGELRDSPPRERRRAEEVLVFEITDERKALERVLMHFAHFEKEAEKIGEKTCRVTLRYDKADETELVIRILSFGPFIRVVSPQRFVNLIRERLIMQKKYGL